MIPGPAVARDVAIEVAADHGIDPLDVFGRRRSAAVAAARRDVWRRLIARGWSSPRAAAYTGHVHSTVCTQLGTAKADRSQIATSVSKDVYALIKETAKSSGLSVSACVRSLVMTGLASRSKGQSAQARIIRLYQSGELDTSIIGRAVGVPEAHVCDVVHAWRELRRTEA